MARKRSAPVVPPATQSVLDEDEVFIPMHASLDTMSEADLDRFAMQNFGKRVPEDGVKAKAETIKQWVRHNTGRRFG